MQSEFVERVHRIPVHGLGLSVDVYTPDLFDLADMLEGEGIEAEYFEIFQASLTALQAVGHRLSEKRLAYHGEGLWITQPEFSSEQRHRKTIAQIVDQLHALKSAWLNLECAAKQMGGYSFGTYLPPLYTELGARMTAENLRVGQQLIDLHFQALGAPAPLLLLEMPPLTYFAIGSESIAGFYERITREAPCGLVLDIGHLWTVYRYTAARRTESLDDFIAQFLAVFPLERVVEIHVAGLEIHAASRGAHRQPDDQPGLPRWIDAHGEPIPSILFDMLQQVLESERLINLKGIALEVDNKPMTDIVSEFRSFRNRFEGSFARCLQISRYRNLRGKPRSSEVETHPKPMTENEKTRLLSEYELYALLVTGQLEPSTSRRWSYYDLDLEALTYYRQVYLLNEILHWGGEVADMFPHTNRLLAEAGVPSQDFVTFWFSKPRVHQTSYDFFLLKIDYFIEFVSMTLPAALPIVSREADELRAGYDAANQRMNVTEPVR